MTKAYGADKGNIRLAARYLGTKEYYELNNNLLVNDEKEDENDENLEIDTENGESVELPKKVNEYLKSAGWYVAADALSKKYDEYVGDSGDDATLAEVYDADNLPEREKEIILLAEKLEGVFTNYGQHAAGTIISADDVSGIIPLMWNDKKEGLETQCTMAQAEAKGLLKMDFLGLRNLDIITDITRYPTFSEDMDGILQDYSKRAKLLSDMNIFKDVFWTGLTQGVFQFESPGMKDMLRRFKPETFEDLILLVAAYRPGPMKFLNEIIQQKQYDDQQAGKPWALKERVEKPVHTINIDNKTLNEILSPTYGCIIYQEQVMAIFKDLAGYSLGGADLVRRAMSKKHLDELVIERQAFIYGDESRGIDGVIKKSGLTEEEGNKLFDQMEDFAKYAFNKSHATAYALVAFFTAYLKRYHTADFFRTSLNYTKEMKEMPAFIQEMQAWGIKIKGPSIMESENRFSVEEDKKTIRYGLKYIKGFSEQNIKRTTNLQEFITANPDLSFSTIAVYAKLGMFDECWEWDVKHNRTHGNRHEVLRWLEKNGELYRNYLAKTEKRDNLEKNKNELKEMIINASSEEIEQEVVRLIKNATSSNDNTKLYKWFVSQATDIPEEEALSLVKAYKSVITELNKCIADRKALVEALNENYTKDRAAGRVPNETNTEILENRKWEMDYLSIPFCTGESLEKIKQCSNKKTFETLHTPVVNEYGLKEEYVWVPAVVLSVSEEKKTKKGKPYVDVALMDRDSNIITRRFTKNPEVVDGIFKLTKDECKFYLCDTKFTVPVKIENNQNISTFNHTIGIKPRDTVYFSRNRKTMINVETISEENEGEREY